MNLLQIMASNKHGGAERFFCRLAQSFAQSDLQQTVMVRKGSPYVNLLEGQVPYRCAPFSGLFDFKSTRQLKKQIDQQAPDIILTWMNRATALTAALHRSKKYQHIARLGGYYNLKHYNHCDHFIGNTKGITDYLIRSGIPSNRVHHVSNFANEVPGTPLTRPQDRPLLIALGRLHPNKAFDTLIRAMVNVKEATLWIGGTGPLESTLKKLIQELKLEDRVSLLGWIEKPEDLIATGDVFICPSRHEPLGNVILEAWAQGKPVVATQNQGALELITHKKNGYLSAVDNVPALTAAINAMLYDATMRSELTIHGSATYRQKFSKAIITEQYLRLFQSI